MRGIILLTFITAVLAGCYTYNEEEWVARKNADPCTWPPIVAGQAFPDQRMCGDGRR